MSFLESLYRQHEKFVKTHPEEKLDPPSRPIPSPIHPAVHHLVKMAPPPVPIPNGHAVRDALAEARRQREEAEAAKSDSEPVQREDYLLVECARPGDPPSAPLLAAARSLSGSDDYSGWVPDRPTLHSLRRDISSGIREMLAGFIAGCRDYVTGGGR